MKRILCLVGLTFGIVAMTFSQGEFDALKYSQSDIVGSARYMSMAGAFGSLGGDISSINNNPAGLGVYRSSELSISLGGIITNASGNWNGKWGYQDQYSSSLNNIGYVLNIKPDYGSATNTNFAITYNKIKNYDRAVYLKGDLQNSSLTNYIAGFTNGLAESALKKTDSPAYEPYNNVNVPWLSILAYDSYMINPDANTANQWNSLLGSSVLVSPTYALKESGNVDEWAFSYGANFDEVFYLGASLGIQSVNYTSYSEYSESFGANQGMKIVNNFTTSGSGLNLKIGGILRPVSFLRLGLSFQTPTFYNLTDTYSATLYYPELAINSNKAGYANTPTARSSYTLNSPLKVDASAAFVLGKVGLVSAEYQFTDNNGARLGTTNGVGFTDENDGIRTYVKDGHLLKVGGEYKVSPNFSLRAGWAYSTPAIGVDAKKLLPLNTTRTDTEYMLDNGSSYWSAGFGYRESSWYLDVAYLQKTANETFYEYFLSDGNGGNVAPAANISTITNNIVCTLGFKF